MDDAYKFLNSVLGGTYYVGRNAYRKVRSQYRWAYTPQHVDPPQTAVEMADHSEETWYDAPETPAEIADLKWYTPGHTKKAALETPGLGGKLGVDELGYARWGYAQEHLQ